MTIFAQRLELWRHQIPGKIAVVLQEGSRADRSITYEELLHGATTYANTYRREGIKPGEVIVLILQHGADLVFSFWGAILQGAIPSIMPYLTEKLAPEQYRADLATLISV